MTVTSQDYAYLSDHSYDRQNELAQKVKQDVTVGGVVYTVLAHSDRPSGYQGTIYQRKDTGEIIVAHRGTEFEREQYKDLIKTDGAMGVARTNLQAEDAIALTREALRIADVQARDQRQSPSEVTVTGHSLGGTLAQITAHHFGLRGETFNAYGAASLDRRIPTGGNDVINHVMGADMVSAASPQYGQVRVYTNPREIDALTRNGYENNRSQFDLRLDVPAAIATLRGGSHDMGNFLPGALNGRGVPSVLDDPAAQRLATQYDPMLDKYRADVLTIRAAITISARGGPGLIEDAIDGIRGPLPPGEPARREEQQRRRGASLSPDDVLPDMRDPGHAANPDYRRAYAAATGVADFTADRRERASALLTATGAGLSGRTEYTVSADGRYGFVTSEQTGPPEARDRLNVPLGGAVLPTVVASTQTWQGTTTQRLVSEQPQPQDVREREVQTVRPAMA